MIEQVKKGELGAFEKLVRETQQCGFNIAYGILNDPQDAEEILQEAYLQVFHNISKLKAPEAFRSWFGKIITHLAFRHSKEKGIFKTVPLENIELVKSAYMDRPENLLLQKENQELVAKAIKILPDEYRAVLILREWEDYSYQEIGNVLDIPLGTVKSRIYSARRMLMKILSEGDF